MAECFGQDPFRLINEWPERFKDVALAWMDKQWNKPSRTDYYLMRIAQRIQQQWSKKNVTVKDQIVEFKVGTAKKKTMEQRVAESKSIWLGGVKAAQSQEIDRGHRT